MYTKLQVVRTGDFLRRCQSNMPYRLTAKQIRTEFIDYFTNRDHVFVRSSSVSLPLDRSVPFANAGMNQFKGVLLNYYEPPAPNIVNSQKCVRVGGKHNDLNIVGTDTYHHTFFEMLGSWSFDNYYKRTACQYALDLLTGPYGIKKECLYVTYFGGDETLKLEPDLECKDIWQSLGIPENKILPFGVQENFWEMGLTGPCGPCTEIHIDHKMRSENHSANVNKGYADLTELWNLVFIQYNRLLDGRVVPLPKHHVDTGMGFERLVTLLQRKSSNYDTDLFQPLFDTIKRCSNVQQYNGLFGSDDKNGIDYGYRVMADHARMIAVTLADGMIPQEHAKLRRVVRRAFDVSEKTFKNKNLLSQLMYTVAESLGDVYPELQNNVERVQKIINYEQDTYAAVRKAASKAWKKYLATQPELSVITDCTSPGLIDACKYLQSQLTFIRQKNSLLPGDIAYTLYETYGLTLETIAQLAKAKSLTFDETLFEHEFADTRMQSRTAVMKDTNEDLCVRNITELLKTDDSYKYKYVWIENCYIFPPIQGTLLAMQKDLDDNVNSVVPDRTPFCSREETKEGQISSDKGSVRIKDLVLNVHTAENTENCVIHYINRVKDWEETVQVGAKCTISIDSTVRLAKMRHLTGAHLLIAALKSVCDVARNRYFDVSEHGLKLKFYSFGEKLTLENLICIEQLVNDAINERVPVTAKVLNDFQLLANHGIVVRPGVITAHTGIKLVHINGNVLKSKRVCKGLHVHNTGILKHFCLLDYSHNSDQHGIIRGAFGPPAELACKAGNNLHMTISSMQYDSIDSRNKDIVRRRVTQLINDINMNTFLLPYVVRTICLTRLQGLNKNLARSTHKEKRRVSRKGKKLTDV